MTYTEKFSEVHYADLCQVPVVYAFGAQVFTSWYLMSNYQRGQFILMTGTMVATSTIDLVLQQDILGDGASAKAFTPAKAITQLTAAGGDGDDLVGLQFRTEEMDVDGDFKYVRAGYTVGTANSAIALLFLKFVANYPPVPTTTWTHSRQPPDQLAWESGGCRATGRTTAPPSPSSDS